MKQNAILDNHGGTTQTEKKQPQQASILFEKMTDYLDTRLQLIRLKAAQKSSAILSELAGKLVLFGLLLLFVMAINIGVGLWLGFLLGAWYQGFFILAGFYGICILIYLAMQNKWVKTPVSDSIIRKMTKDD